MQNMYTVFVEAFRDVWALLAMIATITGFVLVIYNFHQFPLAGTLLKVFGFYEVTVRFVYYTVERFSEHDLPQTLKNTIVIYILFGTTLTHSYYVFCRKGNLDVQPEKRSILCMAIKSFVGSHTTAPIE